MTPFNLKYNEPLSGYNTWRVGGETKRLFIPSDIKNLTDFLQDSSLKDSPLFWMGLGSNLLIPDEPYKGTVVLTRRLANISLLDTLENTLRFEAGVSCGTAARHAARLGLTGIEFLAGVPGTIGGALAMNAGAHGQETWQFVTHCEVMNHKGEVTLRSAADFSPHYRHVVGLEPEKEWFVAGYFQLIPGDKTTSLEKIKTMLAHRAATQPINLPNCGSVFRNPVGHYAAKLIESSGLKNTAIGGARVSEKHANFIITDHTATAQDIHHLIEHIQQKVKALHGIDLVREVKLLA